MSEETKQIVWSYLRSALAAGLAVVMAGNFDWRSVYAAVAAAVFPPLLRWLNPNDPTFGLYRDEEE